MDTYIIDTTLRDGEQAPGVVFSTEEKLYIAHLLNELGVDEVEAGSPAIGHDEQEAIRLIASYGFNFVTSSWCRANHKDISEASGLKTQSVNISLPVSDIQINTLEKNRNWILKETGSNVGFAARLFPHVTMGAQDATRADRVFLKEFIFHAADAGAHRVRISDTVGISDPVEIMDLFKELTSEFPDIQFEFHGHNDLGMATANSISAIRGGADCLSATVNGLGERAGNAVLEEIVSILKYKKGADRFNLKIIKKLSDYVFTASGKNHPKDKPLTGRDVFTHESGIHVSQLLKNIKSYQFIDPEEFEAGGITFMIGKHTGKSAIADFFRKQSIPLSSEDIEYILSEVKTLAFKKKRNITDAELLAIYSNLKHNVVHRKY